MVDPTDEEREEQEQNQQGPSEVEQLALAELTQKVEKLAAETAKLLAQAKETEVDATVKTAEFIEGDADPETQVRVT